MQLTMTHLLRSGKAVLGADSFLRFYGLCNRQLMMRDNYSSSAVMACSFGWGGFRPAEHPDGDGLSTQTESEKPKAADEDRQPRNRGFYVLAASQFFISMGTYNAYAFIFIYFNQDLGMPSADIGLWAAILGVVEIPFFYVMDAILPRRCALVIAYIVSVVGIALFTIALGAVETLPVLGAAAGLPRIGMARLSSVVVSAGERHQPPRQRRHQSSAAASDDARHFAPLGPGRLFGWVFDNLGANVSFFVLLRAGLRHWRLHRDRRFSIYFDTRPAAQPPD